MSIIATINQNTALSLLLEDDAGSKYPQAKIFNSSGALIATRDLSYVDLGRYSVNHVFTSAGDFFVVYITYNDPAHTDESESYYRAEDRVNVSLNEQEYSVRQAWTRNAPNMIGTVWLERNGQRLTLLSGDTLQVTAKVAEALAFSSLVNAPNVDGRFNIVAMYQPSPGTLIDIDAQVTTTQGTFRSQTSLSVPKLSA